MALLDYTDYATIRGVVGVAETEVPDDVLALPMYEQEVLWALDEMNETIRTQYGTIAAVNPESGRTLRQSQFYELVRVYAAYVVAQKLLGGSIALFAPREITDGKATQIRVEDPFSSLRQDVGASLSAWRERIGTILALLDPTQTVAAAPSVTYFSSAAIGLDPVTGA